MHWDGTDWTIVPSPNLGAPDRNYLNGVVAISHDDVWAVGHHTSQEPNSDAMIMHWNGAQWDFVPDAATAAITRLNAVTAISGDDVWAVGYAYSNTGLTQPLVERWNGTQWSVVPSPTMPDQTLLEDVAAISRDDVWVVGWYSPAILEGRTFTMRWNGVEWNVVPSPNTNAQATILRSISAMSPTDVWAVGASTNPTPPIVLHWDGTQWNVVPGPSVGTDYTEFWGVQALSSTDVWAVGDYSVNHVENGLVSHWDGTSWRTSASVPNSQVAAITAIPGGTLWSTGQMSSQTLTMRYNSACATSTPTPTRTATTTPTYSSTPTNPTNTPSSTAVTSATPTAIVTPCAITFTDVLPTDYFYEPVRYLYCNAVISGYNDSTFRPYNNTTRGQLTKIVVLGFGLDIYTPSTPTFTDVPVDHPFYLFIETAAHEGLVSGYADNTFRPFANVTRGQLSKIVVEAAGWPLYIPPTPTFSDVPADHPFYAYVETAHQHAIISGYSDNTFRPYNDATRGQISKIVYLAVTAP
jgi:hypothetical protein